MIEPVLKFEDGSVTVFPFEEEPPDDPVQGEGVVEGLRDVPHYESVDDLLRESFRAPYLNFEDVMSDADVDDVVADHCRDRLVQIRHLVPGFSPVVLVQGQLVDHPIKQHCHYDRQNGSADPHPPVKYLRVFQLCLVLELPILDPEKR